MKMKFILMIGAALTACSGGHHESRSTRESGRSTSSIEATVKSTATAAPAATQAMPRGEPIESGAESKIIVDEHNRYRAKHCAKPLAWSAEVAKVAEAWAARCELEHSKSQYGENLAMGTSRIMTPEHVVEMWYREVSRYDFAKPGFGMSTGHFTQVVWKKTTHIGCGSAECNGQRLWVCNYDPPGNYTGEFPTNVAPGPC